MPNHRPENSFNSYGPPPPKHGSSKPTVAGLLLVLAAVLGLITSAGLLFLSTLDYDDIVEGSLWSSGEPEFEGTVEGRVVYAENGTAAPDVFIEFLNGSDNTTTDENGQYKFPHISAGTHTLVVAKHGYNKIYHEFRLTEDGEEIKLDFELVEGKNETFEELSDSTSAIMSTMLSTCGVLILIFSIFTFIGAYYSFKRTNYWLAKLGAVFGIFSIGIVIGFLLSIIALILLLLAKDSFS